MPLSIYLAIRNALTHQVRYFSERKAKAMPKHVYAWEHKLQGADAALRWLDAQTPDDVLLASELASVSAEVLR